MTGSIYLPSKAVYGSLYEIVAPVSNATTLYNDVFLLQQYVNQAQTAMLQAMDDLSQQQLLAQQFGAAINALTNPYASEFPPAPVPSPAVIAARQREEARKRDAVERAAGLLRELLTPDQCREYEDTRSFTVLAGSGTLYRINPGWVANIDVLAADGQVDHRLCVHPEERDMPVEDVMIAQLLHLRSDEAGLLRIANRHERVGAIQTIIHVDDNGVPTGRIDRFADHNRAAYRAPDLTRSPAA